MKGLCLKRGARLIFDLAATAVGVAALVCYILSADDKSGMTETHLSALVLVPLIAALVAHAAVLILDKNYLRLTAAILWLCVLLTWVFTQIGFIVNVFMGIDGNVFGGAYIATFVCVLAALALSLLSRKREKKRAPEEK